MRKVQAGKRGTLPSRRPRLPSPPTTGGRQHGCVAASTPAAGGSLSMPWCMDSDHSDLTVTDPKGTRLVAPSRPRRPERRLWCQLSATRVPGLPLPGAHSHSRPVLAPCTERHIRTQLSRRAPVWPGLKREPGASYARAPSALTPDVPTRRRTDALTQTAPGTWGWFLDLSAWSTQRPRSSRPAPRTRLCPVHHSVQRSSAAETLRRAAHARASPTAAPARWRAEI